MVAATVWRKEGLQPASCSLGSLCLQEEEEEEEQEQEQEGASVWVCACACDSGFWGARAAGAAGAARTCRSTVRLSSRTSAVHMLPAFTASICVCGRVPVHVSAGGRDGEGLEGLEAAAAEGSNDKHVFNTANNSSLHEPSNSNNSKLHLLDSSSAWIPLFKHKFITNRITSWLCALYVCSQS